MAAQPCAGYPGAVCGCDGITYPTECAAYSAGINVRHLEPCEAG